MTQGFVKERLVLQKENHWKYGAQIVKYSLAAELKLLPH